MQNNAVRFSRYLRRLRSLGLLGDVHLPNFIDDYTVKVSQYGTQIEEPIEGVLCDFNGLPGTSFFAIQIISSISGSSPVALGKIQHSDDSITWSDVPDASFSPVSSSNSYQVISFTSSKRYFRIYSDSTGFSPIYFVTALIMKVNE